MSDKYESRSPYAVIACISVVAILLAAGVYCLRANSNPRSLVGHVLRGEALPTENSSLPDWREASLRPDEFRLTIERVLDDSGLMVVKLKIETLQPQWHIIWSRGTTWFGQSGSDAVIRTIDRRSGPNEDLDNYYTGNNTLTAGQISYQDKQLARMSLGGGSTTMEVPLKTPLKRVLEVTAKDGIYSLHEPIVIGSAFGVPVKLAVGDRAKVDALESTFTDSSEANEETE